ncbi:hypothetical protein M2277_005061 [Paenibacillus sp. LBL]|uniref:hypothetical protein n=1 Tax=Paenibacillus sp. LBL TaxID=2940563 RepID=UPI002474F065|nr:hypothetical protein [Paenibacillus sp. LBL]MDH6674369.1 hypothetical protein [Paenibacillus sp. LBL]
MESVVKTVKAKEVAIGDCIEFHGVVADIIPVEDRLRFIFIPEVYEISRNANDPVGLIL